MADTKISGLSPLVGADLAVGDLEGVVDISDATMAITGTNKRMTQTERAAGMIALGLLADHKDTEVIVKQASDLAGTLDSTKTYFVDGMIDMGGTSIEVPEGGLTLWGNGYNVAAVFSTADNAVLFSTPSGGYAGDLNLMSLSVYVTGVAAQVFDLDNAGNNGAFELNTVNLGTFGASGTETTSLGELTAYRQMRANDCAIIRIEDGLTFSGTWSGGFKIGDTVLLSIPSGPVTVFKEGTALDFQGSSTSDLNALSVDDTAIIFDFDEANFSRDEGFALNGARFNLSDAHNPVPNMPDGSTKRFFKDCSGVRNTHSGGSWEVTTQALTALTVNVPAKMAGTTTYTDLIYFSQTVDNAFVFDSTVQKDYQVTGYLVIDGGPNDEISVIVRKWDDSAAAYTDVRTFTRQISNLVGGLDVGYYYITANVREVDENDRVEIWLENTTDGTDVTVLTGSYLDLSVRLG